jgi:predicted dehydrogenase
VNGAPLRRPAWFFDVRVQGDGIADIPTHMVDQVQRLVAAASRASVPLELVSARRWATRVPRTMYARVTGEADFPPGLGDLVAGADLSYYGNAELSFRVGGVTADLDTRWDLSAPAGGGDTHRSVVRGSRAEVRVEQDASTSFRRRLSVVPRGGAAGVDQALDRAVASWQAERPGVALGATGDGWEILVPRALDAGHESHFPLVLADFLAMVERGAAPSGLVADTLAKYELLARASAASSGLSETRG